MSRYIPGNCGRPVGPMIDIPHAESRDSIARTDGQKSDRHIEIEWAKGILMVLYRLDAETAFSVISQQSQNRNIKVHLLARRIVDAAVTGDEQTDAISRAAIASHGLDALLDRTTPNSANSAD